MIKQAVILAGGWGERFRKVVKNVPKPMALVANRPFLEHLLDYLDQQGIRKATIFVSYKAGIIKKHFGRQYQNIKISYVERRQPPETGGSIKAALKKVPARDVLVINGDTIFKINLADFYSRHRQRQSDFTIALKPLFHAGRYGNVTLAKKNNRIIRFEEKKMRESGLINGGFYIINRKSFFSFSTPEKFSIEKDFLEKHCRRLKAYGYICDDYFIDIGTPTDYKQAQSDFV